MPHKKFQHLIKCLAIYLAQQNKKGRKENRKEKGKGSLPGHSAQLIPPGQAHLERLSSTPAGEHTAACRPCRGRRRHRDVPGHAAAFPPPSTCSGEAPECPRHSPSLAALSQALCALSTIP